MKFANSRRDAWVGGGIAVWLVVWVILKFTSETELGQTVIMTIFAWIMLYGVIRLACRFWNGNWD